MKVKQSEIQLTSAQSWSKRFKQQSPPSLPGGEKKYGGSKNLNLFLAFVTGKTGNSVPDHTDILVIKLPRNRAIRISCAFWEEKRVSSELMGTAIKGDACASRNKSRERYNLEREEKLDSFDVVAGLKNKRYRSYALLESDRASYSRRTPPSLTELHGTTKTRCSYAVCMR